MELSRVARTDKSGEDVDRTCGASTRAEAQAKAMSEAVFGSGKHHDGELRDMFIWRHIFVFLFSAAATAAD